MRKHLIIVGFGPVAGYKYSRCIRNAVENSQIISYSIVDLKSQQDVVKERIEGLPIQPTDVYFLPDEVFQDKSQGIGEFDKICTQLRLKYNCDLKIVIATEPQAHEIYLNYCIEKDYDSLVTKPITIPMKNSQINISEIKSSLENLILKSKGKKANHSVLCLSRYHEIYNEGVQNSILSKIKDFNLPITSLRLNTRSGVWNLNDEFFERDDHPYKYGYGMLFHGAYHYVDLIAQTLLFNKLLFPNEDFLLDLTSFSAFPKDQLNRIPQEVTKKLNGYKNIERINLNNVNYGETDIVTNFQLRFKNTDKVLTLGTLSLEQTTTGMRSWYNFPEIPYNINGRLHCTDFNVILSTLYSVNGHVVKIPIGARQSPIDLRGKNIGKVTKRSNVILMNDQEFHNEYSVKRPYGNSFSYSAETEIFSQWINNGETKSSLASHLSSVSLLQALSESNVNNGEKITIDFSFSLPNYIKNVNLASSKSYNNFGKIQFAAYES